MDMKAPSAKIKPRQKFIWFVDPFDIELPEDGIFVDGFAGGGGASTGIAKAIGRSPHIAINHDRDSISMHIENHPDSRHYCEDIFRVNPEEVTEGKPVKGAWFSPDCTHHSKARGGKPKEKKIRALSWVVLHWMARVRPTVVFMENVEEITKWGPLDDDGEPIRERNGEIFDAFVGSMQDGCSPEGDIIGEMEDYLGVEDTAACLDGLGYTVEWRELVASDYGAPTTRKRLFLVARCDGKPIVWPEPTHGSPKVIRQHLKENGVCNLKKWKPVADVIDWSIPCPSVFASKEEIREQFDLPAVRPLAEKTMARIAEGIRRFVIETNDPFVVKVNHGSKEFRGQSIREPLTTITGKHGYGVVTPFVSRMYGQGVGTDCLSPLGTATAENKSALVSPYIMALQQGGMLRSPERPLHTICASPKDCNLLVAPALMSYYGPKDGNGHRGRTLDQPMATQTTENRHSLVAAFISKHFGGMVGVPCSRPFPTITGRGTQNQLTVATMIKNNHGGKQAFDIREPLRTIMAQGQHHAVTTCRVQEVRAFLFTYYGNSGYRSPDQPIATITAKDRLALGIVMVGGQPYQIIDIGMRMLTPRELFDAQGFPPDYKIDQGYDGRPLSKTAQVARCGNSVSPHPAEALVKANL